jgi:hypothetical protein
MQSVVAPSNTYTRQEQQAVVQRILQINELLDDEQLTITDYVSLCAEKLHLRSCLREFARP